MSVLERARTHLSDLAIAADRAGLPTSSLLSSLQSVGDMVCRIGVNEASAEPSRRYTAEKSGDLVLAAVRVQREALVLHAAARAGADLAAADAENSTFELAENEIFELSDLLETVNTALRGRMRGSAQPRATVWRSEAAAISEASRQLVALGDRLSRCAVPDVEGDR